MSEGVVDLFHEVISASAIIIRNPRRTVIHSFF